jgi:hypothetical protein
MTIQDDNPELFQTNPGESVMLAIFQIINKPAEPPTA